MAAGASSVHYSQHWVRNPAVVDGYLAAGAGSVHGWCCWALKLEGATLLMVLVCFTIAVLDCDWQGCLESRQSLMLVTADRLAMSIGSSL